ncbi:hypothetical protein [Chryseobacterium mucoviscidosis]|uniref:hypothetical protein n=1 Tax=Chryseobacterium mucoviscidosis TaxID=1945581 RepID=UPI0031D96448
MKKIDEAVAGYEEEFDVEIMRQNNGAEFRFNGERSCRGKCRGKNKTMQRMIIDNSLF